MAAKEKWILAEDQLGAIIFKISSWDTFRVTVNEKLILAEDQLKSIILKMSS